MFKRMAIVIGITLVLGACGSPPAPAPTEPATEPPPTATTAATATQAATLTPTTEPSPTVLPSPTPLPDFNGVGLESYENAHFASAGTCDSCHTDMRDANNVDISTPRLWSTSMKANSAIDPYWQAAVRLEVETNPELRTVIEDKCATCHMPMARTTDAAAGQPGLVLDEDGYLNPANALHGLAMDGVSCTLCHQIEPDNLGEAANFSGGFVIDTTLPEGERRNYGPFVASDEDAQVMANVSGFVPVQSDHMQQSEMCASCHTLYTPYLDENGEIAGEFPEQMAYFEWLNSDHAETASCQTCHMPEAEGEIALSTTSDVTRSPVAVHSFVGANAFMQRMFRTFGAEMGVAADSEDYDEAIARTLAFLQEETATLSVTEPSLEGDTLSFDVTISNEAGHKFPTGFPSRRAWVHVTVRDEAGTIVFESGGYDRIGRITGNDNDDDPSLFEPHYTTITSPDEVQIYEPILGTTEGDVTTVLLFGAGYLKDNRLLPAGFNLDEANPDTLPHGAATTDDDFTGGGDTIGYAVDVAGAEGALTITVELAYQSIGYRWAYNLEGRAGVEGETFLAYYAGTDNSPVIIDVQVVTLP